MTSGLIRHQQTGHTHFLTFSCYHRLPYLGSPEARDLFESALERVRRKHEFILIGYVVMPEHVHLLLKEPKHSQLEGAVKAIKLSVTLRRPERPFWLARYYDFNVFTHEKQIEKLKYIHRNPVHRGLVDKPEDWPWSSFQHYATGSKGSVEMESHWTASGKQPGGRVPHVRILGHRITKSGWLRAE